MTRRTDRRRGSEAAYAEVYVAGGGRPPFEVWRDGQLVAASSDFVGALRRARELNRRAA